MYLVPVKCTKALKLIFSVCCLPILADKKRLEAERDAALKQATAVSREYDRLMEEHADLQAKLKKAEGVGESKKDD